MLGYYEAFPQHVHKITHFATSVSSKKLQETLLQLLFRLNKETVRLEDFGTPSMKNCVAVFELGVAEGNGFTYLDDEEKDKILKTMNKTPFQILDVLCAMRFYRIENEARRPLKFDYYMLRFTFNQKFLEVQLFHERGSMHILPQELAEFIIRKTNEAFGKKVLKPLKTA